MRVITYDADSFAARPPLEWTRCTDNSWEAAIDALTEARRCAAACRRRRPDMRWRAGYTMLCSNGYSFAAIILAEEVS